jgi:hypothetical protein
MDSATATSQNELRSHKVSLHKKPNIIQNTKKLHFYYRHLLNPRAVVKQDLYMTYTEIPFCDAAVATSTVM